MLSTWRYLTKAYLHTYYQLNFLCSISTNKTKRTVFKEFSSLLSEFSKLFFVRFIRLSVILHICFSLPFHINNLNYCDRRFTCCINFNAGERNAGSITIIQIKCLCQRSDKRFAIYYRSFF